MSANTKKIIGLVWITLGGLALLFETIWVLTQANNGGAIVVFAAGAAMLWQGITMYISAKRAGTKDK